jgi:hypothetical protein
LSGRNNNKHLLKAQAVIKLNQGFTTACQTAHLQQFGIELKTYIAELVGGTSLI